jgi:hypothetical protein
MANAPKLVDDLGQQRAESARRTSPASPESRMPESGHVRFEEGALLEDPRLQASYLGTG